MRAGIIKKAVSRVFRILRFKRGIYCKYGKDNHFSSGCILYENTHIGNGNYFAPYVLSNNVNIGNFCSIGPGCKLGMAEHDMGAASTAPRVNCGTKEMQLFDLSAPTVIDHDVWLGANVVVKQGVHIGTGAVIGANAVVTHDIPPYAVAVGMPAKVIRYRFGPEIIEQLIASEWFVAANISEAKQRIKDAYSANLLGEDKNKS